MEREQAKAIIRSFIGEAEFAKALEIFLSEESKQELLSMRRQVSCGNLESAIKHDGAASAIESLMYRLESFSK